MNRILTSVFLIGLAATHGLRAQGWIGKYSPDHMMAINGIQEQPDGTVLVTGFNLRTTDTTRVLRIDADGHAIGGVDIPGISSFTFAHPMTSGGFALVGHRPPSTPGTFIRTLARVGADGQYLWSTDIDTNWIDPQGPNGLLGNMAICSTADEGLLVVMHPHDAAFGRPIITLKRLDPAGAILWERTYLTDRPEAYGLRLASTSDDGAIISVYDPQQDEAILLKVNATGGEDWSYTPDGTVRYFVPWIDGEGQVRAYGSVESGSGGTVLVTLNGAGDLLQSTLYPALTDGLRINSLCQVDGGYAGVGLRFEDTRTYLAFVRFDETGAITLQRPIPTAELGLGLNRLLLPSTAMVPASDGGFFIGGWIEENAAFPHSGFVVRTDAEGRVYPGMLSGTAFGESDGDCAPGAEEPVLNGTILSFVQPSATLHAAVQDGAYLVGLAAGTYTVQATPISPLWELAACNDATLEVAEGDDAVVHVAFTPRVSHPYVRMDGRMSNRMCAANTYALQYCNDGTTPFSGVMLVQADPLLIVDSASVDWAGNVNNVITFLEPLLPVGECRTILVHFTAPCDLGLMGRTLCVEARALPDILAPLGNWDQAHLQVQAMHDTDAGEVVFTVRNNGAGGMSASSTLEVLEDHEVRASLPVQLASLATMEHRVPTNGSTWRATIAQSAGDPYGAFATAAIEGAGTNADGGITLGVLDDHPLTGAYAFQHMACSPLVNSYDPNRKTVQPEGVGAERYVDSTAVLNYTIDFQNTGTAEAYVVRIVDTLATSLDASTIMPGASSHPYSFRFIGPRVVEFLFESIHLPDSASDEPGSHGFVGFSIRQAAGLSVDTRIENEVGIYFDHNPPVITDPVAVTVGWPLVTQVETLRQDVRLSVYPNPFTQYATVEVNGAGPGRLSLVMRDVLGREVRRQQAVHTDRLQIEAAGLRTGSYVIEVRDERSLLGRMQVVIP